MRGPSAKPKSNALARAGLAPGDGEQRRHPGCMRPARDAPESLGDEPAVVGVQADDVGDGAERDQVEQRVQARLVGGREHARARSSPRSASST